MNGQEAIGGQALRPGVRRLRLEHNDIGFLEEAAQLLGFRSRMLQLEAGPNPSRLELVEAGSVSLLRLQFSRGTFICGPKPPGRVFCNITLRPAAERPRVHGRALDAETLVGFDPQREIHFQAPAAHRFAAVLVEERLFWQTAALMGRRDLDPDRLPCNAFRLHPACGGDLRRLLQRAFQQPQGSAGDPAGGTATSQLMHHDLLPLLIAAIETPHCHHGLAASRGERLLITQLSRQLMEERLADPLTLRDLYSAVPTSRRTLVYAFNEVFGMAPMRFLRLQSLQAARHALATAEPDTTTVTVIGQRFGFASGSQFSRVYRQHFGETPSQTLSYSQKRSGRSTSLRVAQRAA
ncbi:MAG: helix-turn-helix transcriptional regulator [Synechococcaceae cyanobacterium]